MDITEVSSLIDKAYEDNSLLVDEKYISAINQTIELLDKGEIRVAEKTGDE